VSSNRGDRVLLACSFPLRVSKSRAIRNHAFSRKKAQPRCFFRITIHSSFLAPSLPYIADFRFFENPHVPVASWP